MGRNIGIIKQHLSAIEDIICEIESRENSNVESDINFEQIDQKARNSAFKDHILEEYDDDITFTYGKLLASFVPYTQDNEKKIKQYYFIARIIQGTNGVKALSDIITAANMVHAEDFEKISGELGKNRCVFLFDVLLMSMLDGQADGHQMEYFYEILSLMGVSRDEIIAITKLVKSVLVQDINAIYENAKYFPVHYLTPYMGAKIDRVITDIAETKSVQAEAVTVYGITFENISEMIDLDEWNTKNITFKNCSFKNVVGMRSKIGDKCFIECTFENCKNREYEDNLRTCTSIYHFSENEKELEHGIFVFESAVFSNCKFCKCGHASSNPICSFLEVKRGRLHESTFEECRVYSPYVCKIDSLSMGAVILGDDIKVLHCTFTKCISCGRAQTSWFRTGLPYGGDKSYMAIVRTTRGNVGNCDFMECMARNEYCNNTTNQIYNFIVSSSYPFFEKNVFDNCTAAKNEGTCNWEEVYK